MSKLGIYTGSTVNDSTGDSLIDGALKINSNFDEIYGAIGDGTNLNLSGFVTSITAGSNISVSGPTGNVTISATSGAASTSNISADTLVVSGVSTFSGATNFNDVSVSGIATFNDFLRLPSGTFSNNQIQLGNAQEFNLQYNSASSGGILRVINNPLNISGSTLALSSGTTKIEIDSSVELYHGSTHLSSKRLETTGVGVTVFGNLHVSNGINVVGAGLSVTGIATCNGGVQIGAGQSFGANGPTAVYYGDGSNLTGTVGSRSVVSATTGSVGAASTTNLNITGFKSYGLLKVGISSAAWVRLYVDESSRTSDAARSYLVDPTPGSGLIAEVRTVTAGISTFLMTPGVIGYNNDVSVGSTIYTSVTNNESTSATITVDLTVLKLEN